MDVKQLRLNIDFDKPVEDIFLHQGVWWKFKRKIGTINTYVQVDELGAPIKKAVEWSFKPQEVSWITTKQLTTPKG